MAKLKYTSWAPAQTSYEKEGSTLDEHLNIYASNGWEVVGYTTIVVPGGITHHLIWRREVETLADRW